MAREIGDVKRHGRHYTPSDLAAFLAARGVASIEHDATSVRVLDPACGDGELLLAAASALRARGIVTVELVGFDLDGEAVAMAERRLTAAGLTPVLHVGDFLAFDLSVTGGKFDLVITNPPYVRTQALGGAVARDLAAKHGLRGRVDLTHAFVSLSPRLLSQRGVLALLCSNRFLSTKAGANIREVLMRDFSIRELHDLGDTKLFAAAVLPAIVIADRSGEPNSKATYSKAYEDRNATTKVHSSLYDVLDSGEAGYAYVAGRTIKVDRGYLKVGADATSPWRMDTGTSEVRWSRVAQATWKTFGELAKIRVGIKTTADSVFISEAWNDSGDLMPEGDLLLPLLTHSNLAAWQPPQDPQARVLYPYDLRKERRTLLDLADYPKTRSFFEKNEERLRSRKYVTDAGREWYEIWVPQKPSAWSLPKIVFPDISELPQFAIDRSGAVVNGDCYWISIPDLPCEEVAYLMVGIGNSSLAVEFYDHVCGNKLYSGRRRWITQYVNLLPVPDPNNEASRRIIKLAKDFISDPGSVGADTLAALDDAVEEAFKVAPERPYDRLF